MASKGSIGLLKRAWNEIPEVVGSTFMGCVGVTLAIAGLVNYNQKDGDKRKHKFEYIIVRPDDPLVQDLNECHCVGKK